MELIILEYIVQKAPLLTQTIWFGIFEDQLGISNKKCLHYTKLNFEFK